MGIKAEQMALGMKLRAEGASWGQLCAEFQVRWGANARQAIRISRGWSQQDVAKEWCERWPDDRKTFKNISTWERWPEAGHMPSLVVLDRLARIYRCSVADLVADLGQYGYGSEDGQVERRSFLGGAAGSLAAAALVRQTAAVFGTDTADYFAAQLSAHFQADRAYGPHVLVGPVSEQCGALLTAVEQTRGDLHRRYLELATAFWGFAGWLAQDAGDLAASTRWLDGTLELAHRSGDPHLVTYALSSKAMLCADMDDGQGTIDLAEAALTSSVPLSAKAQVMAKEQAAVGYALTGNRHRVDQLLDEIETSLDDAAAENHAWGGDRLRSSTGHVVNLHRAHCYGRLGLGHEAAELWSQMNPEEFGDRRDQGVYLARQAAALVDVGEPKAATRHVEHTSTLYSRTGSARMRRELVRLHEKTVPLSTTKAGSDLAEALDQVLIPSGT